ncbi:hypothetical protein LOTGIDRAFT_176544 [Lottia gigantea]|uniref:Uncharacterized protein n=1 Tax=Lottia gigantea TaxID=225164 RepID=V3ZYX1_LOTGI|nr:hypothetical protein LOTGIDRAFT_176544 [Lottia gigantea]ESO96743.1 hypothetical protein LOTGIDRAFT_176544 [Lottia gigantea]
MAKSTAKALNELVRCNMHGMETGDREHLLQFALDYFNDETINTVESEDEEDEFETDVNFIDAPEFQEIFLEEKDNDCIIDFEDDEDDDDKLTPEIIVNEAKNILDSVYSIVSNDLDTELERVKSFNCGCVGHKKGRCLKQFDKEYIKNLRMNINALTNGEKEMFIMGKISCTINLSKMTERSKKVQTERQRYRTTSLIEKKMILKSGSLLPFF